MKFQKIWQSLDFRNNKVINAKTDLPTHEDHIVPQKYVDSKTIYNTQKVLDYINPFKLDWVKNPVNKSFLALFDDIFFPLILPEYINPVFNFCKINKTDSAIIYKDTVNNNFLLSWDINESDRFLNQVPKIVITNINNNVTDIPVDSTSLIGTKTFSVNWSEIQKIEFVAIFNPTTLVKQDSYGDDYVPGDFQTIYTLKFNLFEALQENHLITPPILYRKVLTTDNIETLIDATELITTSAELINTLSYIKTNKQINLLSGADNYFILLIPKIVYDKYLLTINGDIIPHSLLIRNTITNIDNVEYYLNTFDLGYYEEQNIQEIIFK